MTLRARHGAAGMMKEIQASMVDFLLAAHGWIQIAPTQGADAIDAQVKSMLDGQVSADAGIILHP